MFTALLPLLSAGDDLETKRRLLHHCEVAVRRLGEGEAPGRLTQRLFLEVRPLIGPSDALTALELVERHVNALHHATLRARVAPITRCAGRNRRGRPCGRDAMRGQDYCTSHRDLADATLPPPVARQR